ncbi:MAG: pyridoxal phosphate-dependent aminotransferase [Firmicutes bacterium]|nr:pyridoxal phosphate-dependent aminotransferase [Bacillota bacterium]
MYNFDRKINRKGTCSLKWDVEENELPMWVADMDFETAPEIMWELQKRMCHSIFGYTVVPDEWYEAYISWWKRRYGLEMTKDRLKFCTGVVPAISSIIRHLTSPGDNVLILTPVYHVFFHSIINNGRCVADCPLVFDGNSYNIDLKDLEEKLKMPETTLMILSNPHNPAGILWDKDKLKRIGELCAENNVLVISDEIHCDLTLPGFSYTPFATVADVCRENSITCISPTKTFNIAGLQTSAVFVPDENLYKKVRKALNVDNIAEPNVFAVTAAIAAYNHGEKWLEELMIYLKGNKDAVCKYINENNPELKVVPSEATYLLWIDCGNISDDTLALSNEIRNKTGLYLSPGSQFGGDGNKFLRMNIACPREVLYDGLERLKNALKI